MKIFDMQELSRTENEQIALALQNPALRKFLRNMAFAMATDIAHANRSNGQSLEEHHMLLERVKGGLAVVEHLDNIAEMGTAGAEGGPNGN